jgi:hypothetical protein
MLDLFVPPPKLVNFVKKKICRRARLEGPAADVLHVPLKKVPNPGSGLAENLQVESYEQNVVRASPRAQEVLNDLVDRGGLPYLPRSSNHLDHPAGFHKARC